MAEINVVWLNYEPEVELQPDYWDQGMVRDLLENRIFRTAYEFNHYWVKELPTYDPPKVQNGGAVIVLGGARNQGQYIDKLNKDLAKLKWVILFLTGDEEGAFPVNKIKHPNIKIWIMSPYPTKHSRKKYSFLGTGYPNWFREMIPAHAPKKPLDWFFAGQITHKTRKLLAEKAEQMKIHTAWNIGFIPTKGFTEGIDHRDYVKELASAKVAPAPSGPETPDSFRLFEALEVAAIPIPDTLPPSGKFKEDYWTYFFGEEPPFPVVRHYDHLQGYIEDVLNHYPVKSNQVFAWWQMYKYKMVQKFKSQLVGLTGLEPEPLTADDEITILMPTSPYSMHPSTAHIEQTVRDVRVQLPNSLIIIMIDGVRPEKETLRADYEEYQRRLLWLCNNAWDNVLPLRFEEFGHQSTMTRAALKLVTTPYILFAEHDAPLVPDFPIAWSQLTEAIKTGSANAIRLHHESGVHPEHTHLMLEAPQLICGARLWKTAQWSQRPHLASTAFYRDILDKYFSEDSKAFIEHGVYGPLIEAYNIEGIHGWNLWKLWLYAPEGDNIQRSYDLNTRGKDPNYESTF